MFTAVNTSRRQTKQTKVDALSKTQLLAHFVFHIMASQRYISWVWGGGSLLFTSSTGISFCLWKMTKTLISWHLAFAAPKFCFPDSAQQLLGQSANVSQQQLCGHTDARCANASNSLTATWCIGTIEFAYNLTALLPGHPDRCERGFQLQALACYFVNSTMEIMTGEVASPSQANIESGQSSMHAHTDRRRPI